MTRTALPDRSPDGQRADLEARRAKIVLRAAAGADRSVLSGHVRSEGVRDPYPQPALLRRVEAHRDGPL
jgi:hypothetical protein